EEVPMRVLFTLAALSVGLATLSAQTPTPAARLDAYLARWEKTMAEVTTLSTALTRTDTDKVFKTATKYTGWAAYMKSGTGPEAQIKAAFELTPDGRNEPSEKLVCTGTHLYQYVPTRKEIHSHELPRGGLADNAALGLMFG